MLWPLAIAAHEISTDRNTLSTPGSPAENSGLWSWVADVRYVAQVTRSIGAAPALSLPTNRSPWYGTSTRVALALLSWLPPATGVDQAPELSRRFSRASVPDRVAS